MPLMEIQKYLNPVIPKGCALHTSMPQEQWKRARKNGLAQDPARPAPPKRFEPRDWIRPMKYRVKYATSFNPENKSVP